jgi:hypothetical protein
VIILVLLKKLREKPALEFVAAMVLCGCLEYFSSWYLEMTHDGQRWWDYTGYFLNINGRICAEGLLTFGLGGLAIVYLLAPALDNLLSRIDAPCCSCCIAPTKCIPRNIRMSVRASPTTRDRTRRWKRPLHTKSVNDPMDCHSVIVMQIAYRKQ